MNSNKKCHFLRVRSIPNVSIYFNNYLQIFHLAPPQTVGLCINILTTMRQFYQHRKTGAFLCPTTDPDRYGTLYHKEGCIWDNKLTQRRNTSEMEK